MGKVKIGFIGGSGLNNPDILKNPIVRYVETPFGSPSDVLIEGKISGVSCVVLARHGRKHTINPSNVNYKANIWALKSVGCTHVIVSTATGSLKEEIRPGDFVIVDSFIDRTYSREQTFFDGKGPCPHVCHIPMEPAFCNKTRELIIETAKELNLRFHPNGVAVTIEGPRFSTKAESVLYKSWGADLVNMTLVPEAPLAKEAGLCYAAVAMATDYDCWHNTVVDVSEVMATFKANAQKVQKLFCEIVPKIAAIDWTDTIEKLQNMVEMSKMIPSDSRE
ncbi:S-methyl-5'-thioadenosine phosphorylase-like [Cimex lectularius]|uniref:S-methyl-5'-thioadenosine phosphorylase n=1 Tax=Cimex lectularius TaxID=79782 RepID=A0A8I6S5A7_CIMLE|nr:S-methyl-5'-thioadenosine phosphorylase-like [Cimex lectularius]